MPFLLRSQQTSTSWENSTLSAPLGAAPWTGKGAVCSSHPALIPIHSWLFSRVLLQGSKAWDLLRHCGEKLWGEGETPGRAGSFCCGEGAVWVRAAHSSSSPSGHGQRQHFKRKVKAGFTIKKRSFLESVFTISCF